MTANGGDVFPLGYGEWDATNARWSRDGGRLAFISNRDGNTSLWIRQVLGGEQRRIEVRRRRYKRPMGLLRVEVLGPDGRPTPARVSVTGENGRAYAPEDAWIHADDGFDRTQRRSRPTTSTAAAPRFSCLPGASAWMPRAVWSTATSGSRSWFPSLERAWSSRCRRSTCRRRSRRG
jgi:hypothetical protein